MIGILKLFVPKEEKFFDYLRQQVAILVDCTEQLHRVSSSKAYSQKELEKIVEDIRNKSDQSTEIGKKIIVALHKTFITPIDREDIQALSLRLNNAINDVEQLAASILHFKVKKITEPLLKQITILQKTSTELEEIFQRPLDMKRNAPHIETIKHLEEEADRIFGEANGELYNNVKDPIELLKQKELYATAENAIDTVRDTVDILDIVLINNT